MIGKIPQEATERKWISGRLVVSQKDNTRAKREEYSCVGKGSKYREKLTQKHFHDLKLDTEFNKKQKLGQMTNSSNTHGQKKSERSRH